VSQYEAVFNPHEWQSDILLSQAKRKVVLTGRQSGKTTLLKTIVYYNALSDCKEILVAAPTHGSVKELLWRHFTRSDQPLFPKGLVKYQNNQDMILELINGSRITFKGTENIDALLGREVDLLVLDEWQSHDPIVWTYLEPLLASRNGDAVFTGTARRGNHIMDFYDKGLNTKYWQSWRITTEQSGSPAGRPESIAIAKSSMSEEQFLQEYCCLPMSGEGLVYPHFSEDNIIDSTHEIFTYAALQNTPLRVGLDFNVSNMNAIIGIKVNDCFYIIDEISQRHENANTMSMIQEFKRRYPGRRLIIYPDASGRNRSANTVDPNNTNHQLLRASGYNLVFDSSGNPPIEDRIILLNNKIKPMTSEPTFFVSDNCKEVIFSLTRRTYKNNKPIKDNITDHTCDAIEYAVWQLFNSQNTITQTNVYKQQHKPTLSDLINGRGTTK